MRIDVLDHGYISLEHHLGGDHAVVAAARVSYNSNRNQRREVDADTKLLQYLWRHSHTSPFEHVVLTFEVRAPIFVIRQWQRHRTQSYNEESARYSEMEPLAYVPSEDKIGLQSADNKQARDVLDTPNPHARDIAKIIETQNKVAYQAYKQLLSLGTPRELARSVLPFNLYSSMVVTVNLLNLFKFLKLRLRTDSQYEIRVYAEAMLELTRAVAPRCCAAFIESLGSDGP